MNGCPSADELARLLGDELDTILGGEPGCNDTLIDHLGECEHCREVLASLSSASVDPHEWRVWESFLRLGELHWPKLEREALPSRDQWPSVAGYELLDVLGAGGMSVVYKARHAALNRLVALKMMRARWQDHPHFQQRFRSEAEALARLQHPNLVQIHDILEHDGCPVLALEFVDGVSLAQALRQATLPPAQAARLLEVASRAMQTVHDAGIVHRDLKPANILLRQVAESSPGDDPRTPATILKITDFGLARAQEADGDTMVGDLMGTPSYMSPEQARSDPGWSQPATDIYALGAVLYECLTGRPPFVAESTYATIRQVVAEDPVPPSRLVTSLPRDLETICLKCLRKEPGQRYSNCGDLAEDLQRFLEGRPILARRSPWWIHAGKWCRRHPATAALAAAAVVAVAVLLATWVRFTSELSAVNLQLSQESALAKRKQGEAEQARTAAEAATQQAVASRNAAVSNLFKLGDILTAQAATLRDERELNAPQLQPLRARLVKQSAAAHVDMLSRLDDEGTEFTDQKALAYHRLGALVRDMGDTNTAGDYFRQAIELREQARAARQEDLATDSSLGAMLVDHAQCLFETGKASEGQAALEKAIDIFSCEDITPAMANPARLYRLAGAQRQYAVWLQKNGSPVADVEQRLEAASEALGQLLGDGAIKTLPDPELAVYYNLAGAVQRDLGTLWAKSEKRDEAGPAFQRSVLLCKRAHQLDASQSEYPSNAATALCYLSTWHRTHDKPDDAQEELQDALTLRRQIDARFPWLTRNQVELSLIHLALGDIQSNANDNSGAVENYREAVTLQMSLLRDGANNEVTAKGLTATLAKLVLATQSQPPPDLAQLLTDGLQLLEPWDQPGTPAAAAIANLRKMHAQVAGPDCTFSIECAIGQEPTRR